VIRRAAIVSFATLLPPVLELLIFRVWLRFGIGLRLGLPGFVDFDLVFPALFSFVALGGLLYQQRPVELSIQWPVVSINLFLALAFATLCFEFRYLELSIGPTAIRALWIANLVAMTLSAFFFFIPLTYLIRHPLRWLVIPSALIASTMVMVKHLYIAVWPWFGVASVQGVCHILESLQGGTVCSWNSPYYFAIKHQQIKVLFGPPCSGTDGLLLFLIGFSTFLALDSKGLSRTRTFLVFILGIVYALFLNVARVVSIFLLSQTVNNYFGEEKIGMNILVGFFHLHAGWILYAVGWSAFFWALYASKGLLTLPKHSPLAQSIANR
jgi:exosortase/archaeosortase family protein